jgi:DNA-binding CsgD family transcriptional regulator
MNNTGEYPDRWARELTDTEAHIAELAAGGRTNDEIAQELQLSPNTVAWTLTKVHSVLGLRTLTAGSPPTREDA